ncbi:MAG: PilZ domain-containing protein [Bryobacteraceae bacterium]
MYTKNLRLTERTASTESVALGWDDPGGQPKFVLANCVNFSDGGLSVRLNQPMVIRACVRLRSAKLKLAVTATVKYCVRRNSWYQVGFEFTQRMA